MLRAPASRKALKAEKEQQAQAAVEKKPEHTRSTGIDLSPIVEPRQGFIVLAWSLLWMVVLLAVGLYLVAVGGNMLPFDGSNLSASAKPTAVQDSAPMSLSECAAKAASLIANNKPSLPALPCLTHQQFERLLIVTFDSDTLVPKTQSAGSGVLPFHQLPSVQSSVNSNGFLYNIEPQPIHSSRDAVVSALTGVHARMIESLQRIVVPSFPHDSVVAQMADSLTARRSVIPTSDEEEEDEPKPSVAYVPECYGDGGWSTLFPSAFFDCESTNITPRVLHRLRSSTFSLLAVHLTLRHLDQKSGLDGFLHTALPLIDEQTLAVVIHHSPQGSYALLHSGRFDRQVKDNNIKKLTQSYKDKSNPSQIALEDIAPTLSVLFGLPIPVSNEGVVIPEMIVHGSNGQYYQKLTSLRVSLRHNAEQLNTLTRRKLSDEKQETYKDVLALGATTSQIYRSADHPVHFKAMHEDCKMDYRMSKILSKLVQTTYTEIKAVLIVLGFIVIIGATTLALIQTVVYFNDDPKIPDEVVLMAVSIGSLGGFFGGLTKSIDMLIPAYSINIHPYHEGIFCGSMLLILVVSLLRIKDLIFPNPLSAVPIAGAPSLPFGIFSFNGLLAGVTLALLFASPFAHNLGLGLTERDVVLYGLQVFALLLFINAFFVSNTEHRDSLVKTTLLFIVLLRIGLVFDFETSPLFSNPSHQISTMVIPAAVAAINFVLAFVFTYVVRRTMYSSDNLHSSGAVISGVLVPFGLFVSAFYWMLETLHIFPGVMTLKISDTLNFVQYWTCKLGFMSTSVTSMYVWGTDPSTIGMEVTDNNATKRSQVFSPEEAKTEKTSGKTIFFRGIANGIGSSYFSFFLSVYMALNYLQVSVGSAALTVSILQICALLEMYHFWRDKAEAASWCTLFKFSSSSKQGKSASRSSRGPFKPAIGGTPASPRSSVNSNSPRTSVVSDSSDAQDVSRSLRAVFADPYLTTAFMGILTLLIRYVAIASAQHSSYELLSRQLPSDASLGFGGVKIARSTSVKTSMALYLEMAASTAVMIARVYGPNLILGSLAPALFVLWKRPCLRGGESRLLRELSFALTVRFGVIAGVLLLGEIFGLMVSASTVSGTGNKLDILNAWDTQAQVLVVRAMGTMIEGLAAVISVFVVWMAMNGYAGFQRKMKKFGILE
ncbi:hypothetical protein BATDEDRAFT_88561 [Batrachochytrium dendrobatidis JAM81]|uniref:GPI ethanolamine phosphate transferase 2 n=1 Tax=Batrachochytrium dendrobatidis (strain JAM81 / FGSC 10211) TaxID=684364 RepID=F4P2J7_BATDJ|nr:uncharacterized protein BATDEDRAFT_88561 [Batrachochytrium dendrobatidis JAM81]EGF80393.1 hypothetical protein BATDEDRAFT_88561 [Batrachochytrium dendrobatidis JAM81]|eukprot:XP_006679269.1 hypothetical protein BATDEDRAFT_88561 [Batrachochytrium dendrobatidis JAM81]